MSHGGNVVVPSTMMNFMECAHFLTFLDSLLNVILKMVALGADRAGEAR